MNHLPTALLIQRTFAQGHGLPLWNPYFGGGQPLAADPLAALFYPPTHLVHFLSLRNYYLVLIMGHLVFAGLGMLLLARRALKLPHLPALVAAVSFMATPRLLSHLGAGHITILQTIAWFPWLPDYLDPYAYINALLDGRLITAHGNLNFAQFNSSRYNRLMARAARFRGGARYRAYGKLDVQITRDAAPWVAYMFSKAPTLISKRVGCLVLRPYIDLAAACLK